MGTLSDHNTMMPETRTSETVTRPSTGKVSVASKHHHDNVSPRSVNQSRAGMGSGRLPDGKPSTP